MIAPEQRNDTKPLKDVIQIEAMTSAPVSLWTLLDMLICALGGAMCYCSVVAYDLCCLRGALLDNLYFY